MHPSISAPTGKLATVSGVLKSISITTRNDNNTAIKQYCTNFNKRLVSIGLAATGPAGPAPAPLLYKGMYSVWCSTSSNQVRAHWYSHHPGTLQ